MEHLEVVGRSYIFQRMGFHEVRRMAQAQSRVEEIRMFSQEAINEDCPSDRNRKPQLSRKSRIPLKSRRNILEAFHPVVGLQWRKRKTSKREVVEMPPQSDILPENVPFLAGEAYLKSVRRGEELEDVEPRLLR